jgi:hypothetical protein
MSYHNGPLLRNVQLVNVFAGQDWQGGSPWWGNYLYWTSQFANQFGAHLVNSNFADLMLGEYGIGRGWLAGAAFVNDWWWTPEARGWGSYFTDQDVQNRLSASIWSGQIPWPNSNTLYAFFVEPGIFTGNGQQGDGNHHGWWWFNGQQVPYSLIVWPREWTWEDLTRIEVEEVAEAITDPNVGGGWWDSGSGAEIGDTCFDRPVWDGYTLKSLWLNWVNVSGHNSPGCWYPASNGGNYVIASGQAPSSGRSGSKDPARTLLRAPASTSPIDDLGGNLFEQSFASFLRATPFSDSVAPTSSSETTVRFAGQVMPSAGLGGSSLVVGQSQADQWAPARIQITVADGRSIGGLRTGARAQTNDSAGELVIADLGQEQWDAKLQIDRVTAA